jgi:hypothetical protein
VHAGIYLGNNWVINSHSQGVSVLPLNGSWLGKEFAWGRRVLPTSAPSFTAPAPLPPTSTTPGTWTTPSTSGGSSLAGPGNGSGIRPGP